MILALRLEGAKLYHHSTYELTSSNLVSDLLHFGDSFGLQLHDVWRVLQVVDGPFQVLLELRLVAHLLVAKSDIV